MKLFKSTLIGLVLISLVFLQWCSSLKKQILDATTKQKTAIERPEQIWPSGEKLRYDRIVWAEVDTWVIDWHRVVYYNGQYNAVDNENYLVYPQWYKWDLQLITWGFAMIFSGTSRNIIDRSWTRLFQDWKSNIRYIWEKHFLIDNYNIADEKWTLLFPKWIWYGFAINLSDGFFGIQKTEEHTTSKWFLGLWKETEYNVRYNYMGLDWKILCNNWFDKILEFESWHALVALWNTRNIIDTWCNVAFERKYSDISKYRNRYYAKNWEWVRRISDDFKSVSEPLYSDIYMRSDKTVTVQLWDKFNLLKENWDLLFSTWYDKISEFESWIFVLTDNNKLNIADKNWKVLSSVRFDKMDMSSKWYYIVQNADQRNAMSTWGKLLSDWVGSYYELAKNWYSQ